MHVTDGEAAVTEAARILRRQGLSEEERTILSYMGLASIAFWQPSQIAPGVGLSVIRVRSHLRALEMAGYVERPGTTHGSETEFRLTVDSVAQG